MFPSEPEVTVTMLVSTSDGNVVLENILRESIENGNLLSSFTASALENGYSGRLSQVLVKLIEYLNSFSPEQSLTDNCVGIVSFNQYASTYSSAYDQPNECIDKTVLL